MRVNPYTKWGFIVMVWVIVLIAYLLFERLAKSRIGRALEAIREDEIASSSMGINTTSYKVWAFVLGAAVAGVAGSLQAVFILSVTPGAFTFMVSIMVLCMVVLGGMGNFKAVILGAFLIQFISYFPQLVGLSNVIPPQFKQVLFGFILVVMMIWRPQGILGREQRSAPRRFLSRRGRS
jgi:branched-chain amino acid transport system permease protein